ncbi:MAG: hypothetical protein V3V08_02225 [Nannocystaceae bacterium]
MTSQNNIGLELTRTYRFDTPSAEGDGHQVHRHLQDANDALAMALLSLEGGRADDSLHDRNNRAAKARGLLAEAVTALSRAKVFVPGIHTFSVPAVMASIRGVDGELSRLHQLAATLTVRNHALLPTRHQAQPLSPDDEAQLKRVFEGLKLHSKLARVARYRWFGYSAAFGALVPVFGATFGALALACAAFAAWQFTRESQPALTVGR